MTVFLRSMATLRSAKRAEEWGAVISFESTVGSRTVSSGTSEGTSSHSASTREGRIDGDRFGSY